MKKHERGLTLLEMTVSLTVFSVVILIVFQTFTIGSRTLEIASTQSKIVGGARKGIDMMNHELRNSSYSQIITATNGLLEFRLPEINNDETSPTFGDIEDWSELIHYRLDENNDQLIRVDDNDGTTTVIANHVQTFIPNKGAETLTIDMTTQGETVYGTDLDPIALRSTVEFRNQ
ncbi:MAG: prepilin-type N-terminal cleavage/methylation domain-containing protein [Candidatus Omnitrophica bacterium]|nr:prepilin-type N-terminal cleavage/methylation domain-containing protein [Candidatus Omnitrophota bacterium]